jgi:cell fate regulator YaaT (PSP1 superfamily)
VHRSAEILLEDEAVLHAVSASELAIHPGDLCVVECARVPEFGRVIRLDEQSGDLSAHGVAAMIVRRATLHDQSKAKENTVLGRMAAKTVHRRVDEQKLPVHVVQVRYSFDRAVLHVTYTAEDRVDCTELIRTLCSELHARIEMRQIGVRDAARLVGGMGACGRQLCCRSWLRHFDAVSVKMAKVQRLALNPATIGGVCGRLKCCLKYEFECYRRQGENLPKDGIRVKCPEGMGWIIDKDVLSQTIKVRLEDGRILAVEAAAVEPVAETHGEACAKGRKPHEDPDSQRTES